MRNQHQIKILSSTDPNNLQVKVNMFYSKLVGNEHVISTQYQTNTIHEKGIDKTEYSVMIHYEIRQTQH